MAMRFSSVWIALAFLIYPALLRADGDVARQIIPLAVRDGHCEFVVPTSAPDDKFCLIIGSLDRTGAVHRVQVAAQPCAGPVSLPLAEAVGDASWRQRVQALHTKQASFRESAELAAQYPPSAAPASERAFAIFVKESDFLNPASYANVVGQLRGVGRHCQVYVDRDFADVRGLQPTVDDVVRNFDETTYPQTRRQLGNVLDVDRDGRFTILFTPWLARLVNGQVSLEGFVRGSDFYRDLPQPYGNRCDMLYLNTDLKPGPLLRTLLAHEYAHAVVFSEHIFGNYPGALQPQEEETWLNEAIAHLAEDTRGASWDNLDYRISAFLSAPQSYRLVVPDYYSAGLWRSHGNRGATYLFLRWCADRYGPELAGRLVHTSLAGIDNVEVATAERFHDLFREWTVALALSGTGLSVDGVTRADQGFTPLSRIDLHGVLGGRLLCGPRQEALALSGESRAFEIAGTAAGFVLLHSPRSAVTRISVASDPQAALQVTLIRLPRSCPRLEVRAVPGQNSRSIRLQVTAHDADITLDAVAWERLVPAENSPEDTSYRSGSSARDWFKEPLLRRGKSRVSEAVDLPDGSVVSRPFIIKIAGRDAAGHRISGWDLFDPASAASQH